MKPIEQSDRRVVNIKDAAFQAFEGPGGPSPGASYFQMEEQEPGSGFYLYRLAPGCWSDPHEHDGSEQFIVLEGHLIDHDGTVYRQGDFVWLKSGTRHSSHAPDGCLVAVFAKNSGHRIPDEED